MKRSFSHQALTNDGKTFKKRSDMLQINDESRII